MLPKAVTNIMISTMLTMMPKPLRITPVIDNPPLLPALMAINPRMSPTMPAAIPTPAETKLNIQQRMGITSATIPRIREAIANPWRGFCSFTIGC